MNELSWSINLAKNQSKENTIFRTNFRKCKGCITANWSQNVHKKYCNTANKMFMSYYVFME